MDREGRVLGRHDGHEQFTVGQRRGLGLVAAEPLYVLARDARANRVTVGPREALATTRVPLRDLLLQRPPAAVDAVRLRYRSAALPCELDPAEPAVLLREPAYAAAPGQLACLMSGDRVAGSATIAGEPG